MMFPLGQFFSGVDLGNEYIHASAGMQFV